MAIWREILFAMFMRWLVPAAAFAQERSYEWGWGMHPMAWMGGARGARPRRQAPMSVLSCARVLGRAGFADVQVFNLIPDAAEPRAIVATESRMSRRAFAHEIQSARESMGLAGYLVRRAMLQLSIHRLIEPVLFYWGIRPC